MFRTCQSSLAPLTADVIVLGAGIMGSMHAHAARRCGLSVVIVDRDATPLQASVRNFGYHCTLKASPGIFAARAKRTAEVYRELDAEGGLRFHRSGGMQVAETPAQWALLQEFAAKAPALGHHDVRLLDAHQTAEANPITRGKHLFGSLLFESDGMVSSRRLFHQLHAYMRRQGVQFLTGPECNTVAITTRGSGVEVRLSSGLVICGKQCILSLGAHAPMLHLFRQKAGMLSDFRLVKLQMMRLQVPRGALRMPVTGGRTLRFYPLLHDLDSYKAVEEEARDPVFEQLHIHNILRPAPNEGGRLSAPDDDVLHPSEAILGDSHEYAPVGQEHLLDDTLSEHITQSILRSALRFAALAEQPTIAAARERVLKQWMGVYEVPGARHYHHRFSDVQTEYGRAELNATGCVHYVGLAGNGMTFGAAVAEETVASFR